ncbi:hypothetical protein ASF69_04615 [Rhizobium sp. Leaf311]|uniref:anti-CBASS protein Acb1 family protein n=1 Tax=Rhizobium sp. Leaf311 TaxID=1736332 RepID=UPI00071417E9|nr:anti-CBASS Acb1 family protein [Rhizobium sp. Leaf311]KQQ46513.1 hypothetical protein ASF69_04615 [Rhizobium sp. Leaf311]
MNNVVALANYATRQLSAMFPGWGFGGSAKHDHYKDFGYPDVLTFDLLHKMYCRNGIAAAAVDKTALKTWQDMPFLLEQERDGSQKGKSKETKLERDIRLKFAAMRLWAKLAEADRKSMVGGYSGVIIRLKDSKRFDEPVDRVNGGLEGLFRIDPVWSGQLTVADWDTDTSSETYGEPTMYEFNEAAVQDDNPNKRSLRIHPDRIIIWSDDGTVNGRSLLEPGYNDLIDLEKIKGAGGEGFWKNAKSSPVLEMPAEVKIAEMAKAMGVTVQDVADKMNEQVADFQKGFDQMLMLQGMTAKTLGVTLPSPEHFFGAALQSFAASVGMPLKILVGNQNGERASTEDSDEWNTTNMARRANITHPNIMELVTRLVKWGILPKKDWFVDQADLTESSMSEKIDRANKMADTNQKMGNSTYVFTDEEIRAAVGYEPLSDADKYRDETDEETQAALGDPPPIEEE